MNRGVGNKNVTKTPLNEMIMKKKKGNGSRALIKFQLDWHVTVTGIKKMGKSTDLITWLCLQMVSSLPPLTYNVFCIFTFVPHSEFSHDSFSDPDCS